MDRPVAPKAVKGICYACFRQMAWPKALRRQSAAPTTANVEAKAGATMTTAAASNW